MTATAARPAMTAAEVLVASLVRHGVDTIFGIPGTHNLEIYRALSAYPIRHVTPRHEQGAGYAADGFARTSGRPGIALVTSGPAAVNAASALGQSYSDSVPTLLIAPGMPLKHPQRGRGMLHETRDQRAVMAGIVGENAYRVHHHTEITEVVAEVFAGFVSGRPRPAYLEIPLDLLGERDEVELVGPLRLSRPAADPDLIAAAAAALAGAQAPGIIAGGGARGASELVVAVAEALGVGVLTTTNGKGVIAEDHPLALGAALHLPSVAGWLAERDVLLVVGSELAPTDFWYGAPAWPKTLIRIDIDAGQLHVNARPSLPIRADAGLALTALLPLVPADPREPHGGGDAIRAEARAEGARWTPWLDELSKALPRDAIVTADNAMASYYGALGNLPVHVPGGFAFPTGYGTLGYAVPAAIGAKAAHPGRAVIALSGDGGLMFSCQEIATAAAERMSLPVLVFVNGGYGEIRAEMGAAGITPIGVDLPVPDFVALAAALGGRGMSVFRPADLAGAVRDALTYPGPTLLIVNEE